MEGTPGKITVLLRRWSEGDKLALDHLIPIVYPELHRLARRYMGRENEAHTLQTSALINEAYLRLVGRDDNNWNDRGHFFAVASQIMRHVLIDHARKYNYAKRGGGARRVTLDETAILGAQRAKEFVALDEALKRLSTLDPRKVEIVELKYFGGLTVNEIGEVLKIAPVTVKREWRVAKAWLRLELEGLS